MILNTFSYIAPETIQEAVSLLGEAGSEVFTGDQAYVGKTKAGISRPSFVVSLRNVPGLKTVMHYNDQLVIGSSVTFAAMLADSAIRTVPVLVEALKSIKDPHLRNHSNVGGALYHQTPSHGPVLSAFLALDGKLKVAGAQGERQITLENYLADGLTQGEIIKSISLTLNNGSAGSFHFIDYLKAGKIVCGVSVVMSAQNDVISKISLAACGCVSVPQRLRNLENSLIGVKASKENLAAALSEIPEGELVMSDAIISNPSYLLHLLKVLIKRAVLKS